MTLMASALICMAMVPALIERERVRDDRRDLNAAGVDELYGAQVRIRVDERALDGDALSGRRRKAALRRSLPPSAR